MFRKRCTIHGDKWAIAARTPLVNPPRKQFFSGSAFRLNEYRGTALSRVFRQFQRGQHVRMACHERKARRGLGHGEEAFVLSKGALDDVFETLWRKRFHQVIE